MVTEKRHAYNREYNREYHAKNKDRLNARAREYRVRNKDRLKARDRENHVKTKKQRNASAREDHAKRRSQFFDIYGRECACCHLRVERFLTVGHKNNDGKQERLEIGYWGVLRRTVEHPDHTRYETQCYNCQRLVRLDHLAVIRANKRMNRAYADNSEKANKRRAKDREHQRKLRQRQFEIYGSVCACCGCVDQRVLELAHKNNDGAQDRRENGYYGSLRRAVKHPNHDRYEILCANCNEGAAHNGDVCPHKTRGSPTLSAAL